MAAKETYLRTGEKQESDDPSHQAVTEGLATTTVIS